MASVQVSSSSIPQDVTQLRKRVAPSRGQLRPKARPTVYQRVLQVMDAFRLIGSPIDGRSSGGCSVFVAGRNGAGSVDASFQFRDDRYVAVLNFHIDSPTDEELAEIDRTGVNTINLTAFSGLFDLMRVRSRIPTFAPDETEQVEIALEYVFGRFSTTP